MTSVSNNSENCVLEPVIHKENKHYFCKNSDYNIDLWREFTKRWMVVGVFLAVILAVLGPKIGAPGGPLRTQYLSYFPLAYISFELGRSSLRGSSKCRVPLRLVLLSCAHAHLVTPALCVAAVAALRDLTDIAIVKGALYASVGAPCVWLALALSPSRTHSDVTARLLACNYIASLLAVPVSTYLLCELATLPSWRSAAELCAGVLVPHCAGALLPERDRHETRVRVCALALLFAECCARLMDAEGLMYLGDVLVTLLLEATCLLTSAATCWLYARCGLVGGGDALALALASIPKCGFGVVGRMGGGGAACSWGVHSLPAAVAPPLRAALLADMSARSSRDDTEPHQLLYEH